MYVCNLNVFPSSIFVLSSFAFVYLNHLCGSGNIFTSDMILIKDSVVFFFVCFYLIFFILFSCVVFRVA